MVTLLLVWVVASSAYVTVTLALSVFLYFRGDRSGNAGRFTHFLENDRIIGPDDESDA